MLRLRTVALTGWWFFFLSFFTFPLCFLFLLLCSSFCSLFYSLSLSSPLKRPLVQNSTIILCFFSRSLCFSNILSPVFSFSAPLCLPLFFTFFFIYVSSQNYHFPSKSLFLFFFFALHLLCISNNYFLSLTFIPSFHLSLSCIYRRSGEKATPTQSNRAE